MKEVESRIVNFSKLIDDELCVYLLKILDNNK